MSERQIRRWPALETNVFVSEVLSSDCCLWATLLSFHLHFPVSAIPSPVLSPPLPFPLLSFLTSLPFLSLPLIFLLIPLNVFVYFHLMLEAKPWEQSYRKTALRMDLQPLSKHFDYVCLAQSTGEKRRQKQPLKSLSCFFQLNLLSVFRKSHIRTGQLQTWMPNTLCVFPAYCWVSFSVIRKCLKINSLCVFSPKLQLFRKLKLKKKSCISVPRLSVPLVGSLIFLKFVHHRSWCYKTPLVQVLA